MATPERPLSTALFLALLLLSACTPLPPQQTVAVKLAAINDFHGHLRASAEPAVVRGADGAANQVQAGDVAKLAGIVDAMRASSTHFAFVSAGDLVGATPLVSASFDDEPTIEAMNAAGLDLNGVGNHEFDGGIEHLKRLHAGGCPAGGCRSGAEFPGARFGSLAANVIVTATGEPLFPAYAVREFGGIPVAFIGVTLAGTPAISASQHVAGLEFRDEADTVNALVPALKRRGVEAIVVLIHEGGVTRGGPNECVDLRGPIRDIVERFDRAVDVVVSGHTHQAYVCELAGKLVTSAGAYGRFVTEIDLTLDPRTRDVVTARAVNRLVSPETADSAPVAAVVERYAKLAAPLERIVGRVTAPLTRAMSADGESALGKAIADAHLAAGRSAGAVLAFMNPGGIRAPLEPGGDGEITYSQVFGVYPFDNSVVVMTLTGAQILALLEQQWSGDFPRVLQVSSGFAYAWDASAPAGSRVVRDSVTLNGERLAPERLYRVAANSFLAQGGDGFSIFRDGGDRVATATGRDAIASYLEQRSPLAPPSERRITRVGRR